MRLVIGSYDIATVVNELSHRVSDWVRDSGGLSSEFLQEHMVGHELGEVRNFYGEDRVVEPALLTSLDDRDTTQGFGLGFESLDFYVEGSV